ncbi:hypothetical protein OKW22_000281 [Bacilli bacterium PM5-3]|nr:hypothetical protein [Bacilli bacterium PM5-3]
MKKYLIMFAMVIFLSMNNTYAKERSMQMTEYQIDYRSFINKESFIDILDYNDLSLVVEDNDSNPENGIVLYKEFIGNDGSLRRYGEWFKKQDGKWFNYKESIEHGTKTTNELYIKSYEAAEYYFDASKCSSSTTYENDSCQTKHKKSINYYYKEGNRIYISIDLTYPNNKYTKDNMYSSIIYKTTYRDNLYPEFKISVKRDSLNRITKFIYSYYHKDKIYQTAESMKIDTKYDRYDANNVQSYGIKYKTYDEKNRLRGIYEYHDFDDTYYDVDDDAGDIGEVLTYQKLINYHSNGKIYTTLVEKNDKFENTTYHKKMKYRKDGKKQAVIFYKYKAGNAILRKEYKYNAKGTLKGKAYRYTTTYKKGKKKTVKGFYNSKGKIYKTVKVKNRKDFKVAEYEYELVNEEYYY